MGRGGYRSDEPQNWGELSRVGLRRKKKVNRINLGSFLRGYQCEAIRYQKLNFGEESKGSLGASSYPGIETKVQKQRWTSYSDFQV